MHVIAVVAIVGTNPVKTVELLFDCINEVFTSDDCIGNLSDLSTRVRIYINIGLLLFSHTHVV
jgi:hypothetical protein